LTEINYRQTRPVLVGRNQQCLLLDNL
jgi:hypothetical protein